MGTDFHPNHPDITSVMWPRIDGVIALNRGVPGSIIAVLRECQEIVGYLPVDLIDYISIGLNLSRSEVFGVASFYALFALHPKGRRDNLQAVWELVGLCDEYIDKAAPWQLAKNPEHLPRLNTVLNTTAKALRLLSVLLYPYMPHTAQQLAKQLGLSLDLSRPLPPSAYDWETPLADIGVCKGPSPFPRIESKPQGAKPVSESPASLQPTPAAPATTSIPPSPTPSASSPAPQAPAPAQITIDEFLKMQVRFGHLFKMTDQSLIKEFQAEVERIWEEEKRARI